MVEAGGTLFHVGTPSWCNKIQKLTQLKGIYRDSLNYSSVGEALHMLERMAEQGKLGTISVILLHSGIQMDRVHSEVSDPQRLLKGKPLKQSPLDFLAGQIKVLYEARGLTPPPIIMNASHLKARSIPFRNVDSVLFTKTRVMDYRLIEEIKARENTIRERGVC